jgi:hypothetical protein
MTPLKVVDHLNTFLQDQGYLSGVEENIKSGFNSEHAENSMDLRKIARELAQVEAEIMGVFRMQAAMDDGPGLELAKDQLNDLALKKAALKSKKAEAEEKLAMAEERGRIADATRSKILAFPTLWKKGTPAEQKRLLRTIFQFLKPTANSLQVFFWLTEPGADTSAAELTKNTLKNEKRDSDSKPASLRILYPRTSVLPTVQIPAVVKIGVTKGT